LRNIVILLILYSTCTASFERSLLAAPRIAYESFIFIAAKVRVQN